jgi:hypothetical protein
METQMAELKPITVHDFNLSLHRNDWCFWYQNPICNDWELVAYVVIATSNEGLDDGFIVIHSVPSRFPSDATWLVDLSSMTLAGWIDFVGDSYELCDDDNNNIGQKIPEYLRDSWSIDNVLPFIKYYNVLARRFRAKYPDLLNQKRYNLTDTPVTN